MSIQNEPFIRELRKQAKEHGTPLYGAFELTGRCNLNCKMCYVHVMDHKAALQQELSTDQWKELMDASCNAGMMFALLTGGECLIRPDFKDLYLHLYNKGVILSVNTNGVLLNEDMAKFFAAHPPEWVQISLYGSNDAAYEEVTGVRTYAKVNKAIQLLESYHIPCRISITPSKAMLPDIKELLRYVITRKLNYRMPDLLIPPREGIVREDFNLSFEEILDILKYQEELKGKTIVPIPLENVPPAHGQCDNEAICGMPCSAGTLRFVINWKGKMIPCICIDEVQVDPFEKGFDTCWKEIRSIMMTVKQSVECNGCAYNKKCNICPAIRYKDLFSGHCNESVCTLARAKAAAGLIIV